MQEREIKTFGSLEELRAWLAENQDTSDGIWLTIGKKGANLTTVTYAEAVQAGLEFGWIDGQARRGDENSYLQLFTPRRTRSVWSMRNRLAAETMIAEGSISPRGLAEVERAKSDGRWDRAYEGSKNAEQHPEFLAALQRMPAASAFYETLDSQNRYAIYQRIQSAVRPETRARRIESFIAKLERGERP